MAMGSQPAKHLFNVAEYHRMGEAGVFSPETRLELIDGEVLEMAPVGRRHAAGVMRLTDIFSRSLRDRVLVSAQNPIRLSEHSEPQPDLALLRRRSDYYEKALASPQDVLLLVEVADTTLPFDREIKIPLYAQSGIPEVWLVDLTTSAIEVFRHPSAGAYRSAERLQSGIIRLEAFPDVEFEVQRLIG